MDKHCHKNQLEKLPFSPSALRDLQFEEEEMRMSTLVQPAPYALRRDGHTPATAAAATTSGCHGGHEFPDADAAQLVAAFEAWARELSRSVLFQCAFQSSEHIGCVFLDDCPASPTRVATGLAVANQAAETDGMGKLDEAVEFQEEDTEDETEDEEEEADGAGEEDTEDDEEEEQEENEEEQEDLPAERATSNEFVLESPLFSLNASESAADNFESVLGEFSRRHTGRTAVHHTWCADQQLQDGDIREDSFDAEEMFGAGAGVYDEDPDDSCLDDESGDEACSERESEAAVSSHAPPQSNKLRQSHGEDPGHEKNGASFFCREIALYTPGQKRVSKAAASAP
jgi:hypothetical protein